jgi:tellurite resistance protein TehA-like permease
VGTVVTGTSALAVHTGLDAVAWLAVVFYVGLVAAWITVAVRTAHGSVRGRLFRPA